MRKVLLVWLTIVGFAGLLVSPAAAQERMVYVLTVDGAITAAIGDYIGRGIRLAEQDGVEAVVIRLNTPGGDLNSTTRIMERLENARVPVIVYVWPRGGMAASAGTLILLAAHGAAMAPRTTIGAAHPVAAPGTEEAVSPEMLEKVVNVMAEHAVALRGAARRSGGGVGPAGHPGEHHRRARRSAGDGRHRPHRGGPGPVAGGL